MESFPPPDLYDLYSDQDLRVKIAQLREREELLQGLIEDAKADREELIGLLMLRGAEVQAGG